MYIGEKNMDIKYNHEKILIIIALFLCAGILFYNAFFIPEISIPSVIYVNSENSEENSNSSESQTDTNESSNPEQDISNKKININTATETELSDNLTGVGPATAKKIVEYRAKVGKYSSIEDIKNVSGIGEKTFEEFKDMICV